MATERELEEIGPAGRKLLGVQTQAEKMQELRTIRFLEFITLILVIFVLLNFVPWFAAGYSLFQSFLLALVIKLFFLPGGL